MTKNTWLKLQKTQKNNRVFKSQPLHFTFIYIYILNQLFLAFWIINDSIISLSIYI